MPPKEYKIVLHGGCGMSDLIVHFVAGRFYKEYDPTIEGSYRTPVEVDGQQFVLEIFDTTGTFSATQDVYMKNAAGFIIVYDIASVSPLNYISDFYEQILQVKETDSAPVVLVGNKCNSKDERQVSTEKEREELCKKYGFGFVETSTVEKVNMEQPLYELIRLMCADKGKTDATVAKRERKKVNFKNFTKFTGIFKNK